MLISWLKDARLPHGRISSIADGLASDGRGMTHPGVGPITALATEVFLGDPLRFTEGKQ